MVKIICGLVRYSEDTVHINSVFSQQSPLLCGGMPTSNRSSIDHKGLTVDPIICLILLLKWVFSTTPNTPHRPLCIMHAEHLCFVDQKISFWIGRLFPKPNKCDSSSFECVWKHYLFICSVFLFWFSFISPKKRTICMAYLNIPAFISILHDHCQHAATKTSNKHNLSRLWAGIYGEADSLVELLLRVNIGYKARLFCVVKALGRWQ